MKQTKKIVFSITVFLFILALVMPASTKALTLGLTIPFGGKVTNTTFCLCTLATKVEVEGAKGGTFMKTLLTRVYDYNKVQEGKNVLGIASQLRYPCKTPDWTSLLTGNACADKGSYPMITKIGTSN